jgi:hypothetical protein
MEGTAVPCALISSAVVAVIEDADCTIARFAPVFSYPTLFTTIETCANAAEHANTAANTPAIKADLGDL